MSPQPGSFEDGVEMIAYKHPSVLLHFSYSSQSLQEIPKPSGKLSMFWCLKGSKDCRYNCVVAFAPHVLRSDNNSYDVYFCIETGSNPFLYHSLI
jgi:hypothetical protein